MPTEHAVVTLEREALRRWCSGDPSGFLELSAPDVSYFDPFQARRVDGRDALGRFYEGLRGKIRAERYELINPLVVEIGDAAILSYNFVSWGGNENALRWNCTEAFRRDPEGWRIVQTHWSFTQSAPPSA